MSDDDLESRRLCSACVGESYLSDEIEKEGQSAQCGYCERIGQTYSLGEMADRFETVFEEHFVRSPTDPSGYEYALAKEGGPNWSRHGEPTAVVIGEVAQLEEEPANDIQRILTEKHYDFESAKMGEESEFEDEAHYLESRVNDIELQQDWTEFEAGLKGRGRFFNSHAENILKQLFSGIHSFNRSDGRTVVREIGPGSEVAALYRSRAFQSTAKLEEALADPERWIGSPASQYASAGRMNARGVSVFYGATDPTLAISEVRPPVGSRVVLGRFELLRKISVLDVEALEAVLVKGSLFDPSFGRRLEHASFLKRLAARIRIPVMPDDEATDYLATQAMAEYLADRISPSLDGIMYGSAQGHQGAMNVALFNHAARVRPAPALNGSKLSVSTTRSTEDGPEPSYTVFENLADEPASLPEPGSRTPSLADLLVDPLWDAGGGTELRPETLALDRSSLTVHHVRKIKVRTDPYKVDRLSWTPSKTPF